MCRHHPDERPEVTFQRIRAVLSDLICCYSADVVSPIVRQLTQALSASIIFAVSYAVDSAVNTGIIGIPTDGHASSSSILENGTSSPEMMMMNDGVAAVAAENGTAQKMLVQKNKLREAESVAKGLITELLERLGRSPQLFPSLLEILAGLPQDINNKKIAITPQQRTLTLYLVLNQTAQVWNAVAKIFDSFSSMPPTVDARPKDCEALCTTIYHESSWKIDPPQQTLRRLILQCFQTWLEWHSRYHRLSDFSQSVLYPPLDNELLLMRESSVIPILLVNLEGSVKQCLTEVSMRSPAAASQAGRINEHLEVEFDTESRSSCGQVVLGAADAISEALELLYSNTFHVETQGKAKMCCGFD